MTAEEENPGDQSPPEERRGIPAFVGMPTFLWAPSAQSGQELEEMNTDVAVIGAPLDIGTTNRPGARFGPRAIRLAHYYGSPNDNIYHLGLDVYPTRVLKIVDFGDANCPPGSIELGHEAIQARVLEAVEAGAVPIVLGGDHSITLPSAMAVAQHYGFGNVGMIHFDAHADTAFSSFGDVLVSHGTPMRRLIESGAIPGKNFVQVGLRGYWPPQSLFDWMRGQGMRWHLMSEIETRGFDTVLDEALREAQEGPEHIYLSVDVDVLDPAFAPGTGTPEPGGLTSTELLRAVRRIASTVNLVAVDIVEVSPPYDGPGAITAEVAHRVALEAISALAWQRSNGRSTSPHRRASG
ncbi:MAG: agmatinase [SAR202 cluster bacterium]|nr:agmatinase [SAR202 cluster bacterium]